jgi:hypothetical protein
MTLPAFTSPEDGTGRPPRQVMALSDLPNTIVRLTLCEIPTRGFFETWIGSDDSALNILRLVEIEALIRAAVHLQLATNPYKLTVTEFREPWAAARGENGASAVRSEKSVRIVNFIFAVVEEKPHTSGVLYFARDNLKQGETN